MNENIKQFLIKKVEECEKIIKKYKKKHKKIKIIYYTLIGGSIIGCTSISLLSPLIIPIWITGTISGATAIITAISIKFNVENIKTKLSKKIQELNIIKDKLDYVISCNGNLGEEEREKILNDFRIL